LSFYHYRNFLTSSIKRDLRVIEPLLFFGALLVLTGHFGGLYILNLALLSSFFLLFFIYELRAKISGSIISLSFTFFGIFYLAFLLSHAVLLREYERDGKFFLYLSMGVSLRKNLTKFVNML
jgi:hypothetical protein